MSTSAPLAALLPKDASAADADTLLSRFLQYVSDCGLRLYPAQEEAILELMAGKNVILNTPTGAASRWWRRRCTSRRWPRASVLLHAPIKALVNEKFFALCQLFGPARVGMMTGDASVNRDAPILCCTAEVLANMALREGKPRRRRGGDGRVPLLRRRRARRGLAGAAARAAPGAASSSCRPPWATPPSFEESLDRSSPGGAVARISSGDRPVPLDFQYRETPLHETLEELVSAGKAPVYLVNFTQRAAAEQAQNLMRVNFSTKEEKERHPRPPWTARASTRPSARTCDASWPRHRPAPRRAAAQVPAGLVEKLAQTGLLKVISGTDTLGRGRQHPHPHRALHPAVQVRRARRRRSSRPATSTRLRGAPAARASTTAAAWWRRRPSTSSRTCGWRRRPPAGKRSREEAAPGKGLRATGTRPPSSACWPGPRAAGLPLRRSPTGCC